MRVRAEVRCIVNRHAGSHAWRHPRSSRTHGPSTYGQHQERSGRDTMPTRANPGRPVATMLWLRGIFGRPELQFFTPATRRRFFFTSLPVPVPVPPYGWQSGHVMCRPPVPPPPAGYIIRHLHRRVRAPSSSSSIDRHLSLGLQSSPKINKPAAESISGMQAVGIIRRGLTIDPAGEEDRTHDDMRRPLL